MRRRAALLVALMMSVALLATACKKSTPTVTVEDEKEKSDEQTAKVEKAIADLKHKTPERRAAGIRDCRYLYESDIPKVLEVLNDKTVTEGAVILGQPNSAREAAILALLRMGTSGETAAIEKGIPILLPAMRDTDEGVREHTALAIAILGPRAQAALQTMVDHCADPADRVRVAAYRAVDKIGGAPATAFAHILKNPSPKIVFDAARAINVIRPLPKEILPALIDFLKPEPKENDEDELVLARMEVADAIGSFAKEGSPAVEVLIQTLKSTSEKVFDKFFRPKQGVGANVYRNNESPPMMALRRIGKPAVVYLTDLLSNENAFVRWQAAVTLSGIGPEASESLVTLQMAFDKEFERKDGQEVVIAATGSAIAQIGGDPSLVIGKLAEFLKSENFFLRSFVLQQFARFGRKGAPAVESVVPLLDDKDPDIRYMATMVLSALGPAAKDAMPALAAKLADADLDVRRNATTALRAIGPFAADATPALAQNLMDMDDPYRREVIATLAIIGPGARGAVPDLIQCFKKATDDRERLLAIQAFELIGPDAKAAVPELIAAIQNQEIRRQAIDALGIIGDASPDVVKALIAGLKNDRMHIRVASARALARMGPKAKDAVEPLKAFGQLSKQGENATTANVWAAAAIYKLGVDTDANLKLFVAAMKNSSPAGKEGRLAAMDAAELLGPSIKSVLPDLTDALTDTTPISQFDPTPVRQRAVKALGKMGPAAKDAVPKLTALLKESNVLLKLTVIDSLGQIGPDAKFAAARLREIARSEPMFAERVQEALDKIEPQ